MQVIDSKKLIASAYVVYGLVNIGIFVLSSFSAIHMAFWGALSLVVGVGLWIEMRWSLWFALSMSLILLTIGVITLYASVSLLGFNPGQSTLSFHLALILYVFGGLALLCYTILKRNLFHEKVKQ